MDEPKLTKICNACKQALGLEMFCKNKARKDGLDSKCRDCLKIKQKQQYEKHAEKRRAYARKENLTTEQRERKKEYSNKYREEHTTNATNTFANGVRIILTMWHQTTKNQKGNLVLRGKKDITMILSFMRAYYHSAPSGVRI